MTTLEEGELRITLPETVIGRKFDGPAHGLSYCMKAVDWIIELPDRVYFIEVKSLPDEIFDKMTKNLHTFLTK